MLVQTLTPYLCARGAEEAIAFYQEVLGATVEGELWRDPGAGRVGHAELRLGETRFFVSDEYEALEHGATAEREVTVGNGMRAAWLRDPWGHGWSVCELHPG